MSERACNSVGIDLGTTFSSLAYMDTQGRPRMVQDSSGQAVIPSVIYFDENEIIVGDIALQHAKLNANRVVQFIKVHMGDEWRKEFQGYVHTPESLSAIILGHLLREAVPQIGPIPSAVITVPAYFTEKRRRATEQAGEIAGLKVIGTLNEPMAATLANELYREEIDQKVMVYDLGGGTFDITIVHIDPSTIEELATDGNRQLGGRDWDKCLIDFVAEDFIKAHGRDPREDLQATQDLQLSCETVKRQLSRLKKVSVRLHAFGHDHISEITRDQFESITAALLQSTKLTAEIALEDAKLTWADISRVVLVGGSTQMPAVRKMLEQASGKKPDTSVNPVTAVALGAATYAYMLESGSAPESIHQKPSGEQPAPEKPPERISTPAPLAPPPPPAVVPSVATASDAAVPPEPVSPPNIPLQSDSVDVELTTEPAPPKPVQPPAETSAPAAVHPPVAAKPALPSVRFVTAHGVGIRVRSGDVHRNVVLIPKNTQVPASISRRFFTASETTDATYIRIAITQGDTPDIDLAEPLGVGKIKGFPRNEPAGQPVDVHMEFDKQGRLHMRAIYVNTAQAIQLSLDIPGGLTSEQVREHHEYLRESGFLRVFEPDNECNAGARVSVEGAPHQIDLGETDELS